MTWLGEMRSGFEFGLPNEGLLGVGLKVFRANYTQQSINLVAALND